MPQGVHGAYRPMPQGAAVQHQMQPGAQRPMSRPHPQDAPPKLEDEATGFADENILAQTARERWMPILVRTLTGENAYVAETPFYIGRSNYRVHFRINNSRISNMHAAIVLENGSYFLKDMGSLNGTYVSGERLGEGELCPLFNGCVFELAGETFTVIFRKIEV